jgi:hypothetical protein
MTGSRVMPPDAINQRPKRRTSAVILATVLLLFTLGSISLYHLGREAPRDPTLSKLAWGDRVEKRMDALIDRLKPKWADRVESRMEGVADKIGWQ